MVLDSYLDKTSLKTNHIIDKKAHPDDELVYNFGKMVRLGDLRALCDTYEERKLNMYVVFDDVFQYTSLGLLELLFELHDIRFPIPYEEFFKRQKFANDFVKDTVKFFGISSEEVDAVEKEFYPVILARSPVSKNAEAILRLRKMLATQKFIFKWPCKMISDIMDEISGGYYTSADGEYVSAEAIFLKGKTEKQFWESLPKKYYKYLELIACQDAGTLVNLIEKNQIDTGANILTHPIHNGLDIKHIKQCLDNPDGFGFGDYSVRFMKEGTVIC